jgi:type IV pilus assembly protein PilX
MSKVLHQRTALEQARRGQRGVTLLMAIIALVVMTIGAVALVRSTNTSLRLSGNLAFKRDLVNQAERGVALALADLRAGALSTAGSRIADAGTRNYSATVLASTQGIPNVLLNDTAFAAAFTRADTTDAGVTVRYVIDRQCSPGTGAFSVANCTSVAKSATLKAGEPGAPPLGNIESPVYRISVRATGPRGAQTFMQTTLALP